MASSILTPQQLKFNTNEVWNWTDLKFGLTGALVTSDVFKLDFRELSRAGHLLSRAKPNWPSLKNEQNTSLTFFKKRVKY